MDDLKQIIDKIYNDYNPDKIANVPDIIEKYKGKEIELLTKISQKYNLHLEDYITVNNLVLVKALLTKYDPINVSSASSLLASYTGREIELLKSIQEKFNININDIIISIYTTKAIIKEATADSKNDPDVFRNIKTLKHRIGLKRMKIFILGILGVIIMLIVVTILFSSNLFRHSPVKELKNITSSKSTPTINPTLISNPQIITPKKDTATAEQALDQNPQQVLRVNPYGVGYGKITIYKTGDHPEIDISIDGNSIGRLSQTFSKSNPPICDANGTISKILSSGRHHVSGQDYLGTSWDIMVSIIEGSCVLQEITNDK